MTLDLASTFLSGTVTGAVIGALAWNILLRRDIARLERSLRSCPLCGWKLDRSRESR